MVSRQHNMRSFTFIASLIILVAGCAGNRTNYQFTIRVSGDASGIAFDGQCTAQKARLFSRESVAQSLDVKGTVVSDSQPQDYETTGFFIYCSIANQSADGTITVELLRDGDVVVSAQSVSPDIPATIEFGEKP